MIYKILCQRVSVINNEIQINLDKSLYPIKTTHIVIDDDLYFIITFGDIEYIEFAKKYELIEKVPLDTVNIR